MGIAWVVDAIGERCKSCTPIISVYQFKIQTNMFARGESAPHFRIFKMLRCSAWQWLSPLGDMIVFACLRGCILVQRYEFFRNTVALWLHPMTFDCLGC